MQFPGTATEPAKSGPGVAQSIQHLYKEYIAPFETWYISMIQEYKKHSSAALQNALGGSRYELQQLLQMVNMPPAELQSRGVDEKTMQLLETHKGQLQRLLQEQRVFAENVRTAQNAGHGDQNGGMGHRPPSMGPSPPFGASGSQQPQQNLLSMANRTQLQHHMMQPSTIPNGVDALMGGRMAGQQMTSSLTPQGPMGGNPMQGFAPKPSMGQAQAVQLVDQFKNDYAMSGQFFTCIASVFMTQFVSLSSLPKCESGYSNRTTGGIYTGVGATTSTVCRHGTPHPNGSIYSERC